MKPLNGKTYGSIAHLPNSRVGKTDRYITEGQARIATEKPRDSHDLVIIQEKLDGSCVGCYKKNGSLHALTRSGNLCNRSAFIHHHHFEAWMWKHFARFHSVLQEGERIVGEYLGLAHGTRYYPERVLGWEPWVAFDIMVGSKRLPYAEFARRTEGVFRLPPTISIGPPQTVEWVMEACPRSLYGGEHVEGWIWRVERNGYAQGGARVDFLAKYVNPGFEAGCLLPQNSGKLVWNYELTSQGNGV
jgi:hypothetical protein